MRNYKTYISIFFCFIFLCCNNESKKSKTNSDFIKVTDFRNKEIKINYPTKKVVCLIESALSGIYMLKAENNIVGISTNVYNGDVFEQYKLLDGRIKNKTIPTPGNWDFISIENIAALKPDLVIIWASQTEAIQSIENLGIPVYAIMINNTNDIFKEITDFGAIFNKKERADSLISFAKNEIESIKTTIKTSDKKKVYFVWSQGKLETSGKKSTVNEMIELACCENVCNLPDEHIVVNAEKIIEWNPDIILMWYSNQNKANEILNFEAWQNINAVKNKNVYQLPSTFYCDLWTLKFLIPVKMLAKWSYPQEFNSINIEEYKKEIIKKLYDKEI